ncbi:hypothetical protein ADL26_19350, partial [Thermoactinomyces vulgaris]
MSGPKLNSRLSAPSPVMRTLKSRLSTSSPVMRTLEYGGVKPSVAPPVIRTLSLLYGGVKVSVVSADAGAANAATARPASEPAAMVRAHRVMVRRSGEVLV